MDKRLEGVSIIIPSRGNTKSTLQLELLRRELGISNEEWEALKRKTNEQLYGLHSCYDCKYECLDGCCLRRDDNGNREPVYDEPTSCEYFEERSITE